VPEDETERLRSRCGHVLKPLEHDESGTLGHDESVPVRVEGTDASQGQLTLRLIASSRMKPHIAP
jgi:hypothetical protein